MTAAGKEIKKLREQLAKAERLKECGDAFYQLTVAQRNAAWQEVETAQAVLRDVMRQVGQGQLHWPAPLLLRVRLVTDGH